jgi:hypothetical protein
MLQTTFRALQVSRCIDLAQLEDVETLAQCKSAVASGNAIQNHLLLREGEIGLGRMAYHSFRFPTRSMFTKAKDFVGPEHNGHWSCQTRYCNKIAN